MESGTTRERRLRDECRCMCCLVIFEVKYEMDRSNGFKEVHGEGIIRKGPRDIC